MTTLIQTQRPRAQPSRREPRERQRAQAPAAAAAALRYDLRDLEYQLWRMAQRSGAVLGADFGAVNAGEVEDAWRRARSALDHCDLLLAALPAAPQPGASGAA